MALVCNKFLQNELKFFFSPQQSKKTSKYPLFLLACPTSQRYAGEQPPKLCCWYILSLEGLRAIRMLNQLKVGQFSRSHIMQRPICNYILQKDCEIDIQSDMAKPYQSHNLLDIKKLIKISAQSWQDINAVCCQLNCSAAPCPAWDAVPEQQCLIKLLTSCEKLRTNTLLFRKTFFKPLNFLSQTFPHFFPTLSNFFPNPLLIFSKP